MTTAPWLETDPATPIVAVSLGTDHHPFERLVGWVERWHAQRAGESVVCVVQHGFTRPALGAVNVHMLGHADFTALVEAASVVVCQGGPGGISDALAAGHRPLVVPRLSSLGEHVDDHQVAFARRMALEGDIELVSDESRFRQLIDDGLARPRVHGAVAEEQALRLSRTVGRLEGILAGSVPPESSVSRAVRRLRHVVGRSRSDAPSPVVGELHDGIGTHKP